MKGSVLDFISQDVVFVVKACYSGLESKGLIIAIQCSVL